MTGLAIVAGPPLAAVKRLLEEASLPSSDLDAGMLEHFFAGYLHDELAGVVGLQHCGAHALLRSLAVRPQSRGVGHGHALLDHAERHAASMGVTTLYLLTETAPDYFRRRGYRHCRRAEAPAGIRRTREFAALCPDNAAFLCKRL